MNNMWISIAAVIVSISALFVSFYFSRKALQTSVSPILVFVYDKNKGWCLENVGNGPALNVTVADGNINEWFKPVRCYPLPSGSKIDLAWIEFAGKLGAEYTDAHGRKYTSICQKDISKGLKGHQLPRWADNEILRERELRLGNLKKKSSSSSPILGSS